MAEKQKHKETKGMLPVHHEGGAMGVFDEMDRMFNRYLGGFGMPSWAPRIRWASEMEIPYPDIDVYEDGGDLVVKAEIPGVSKDDLKVDIAHDTVTISGEKKKEEKIEKKDYMKMERSYGSFVRTVALPAEVKSADAKAKFKDGVLEIRVPRKDDSSKVSIEVE